MLRIFAAPHLYVIRQTKKLLVSVCQLEARFVRVFLSGCKKGFRFGSEVEQSAVRKRGMAGSAKECRGS